MNKVALRWLYLLLSFRLHIARHKPTVRSNTKLFVILAKEPNPQRVPPHDSRSSAIRPLLQCKSSCKTPSPACNPHTPPPQLMQTLAPGGPDLQDPVSQIGAKLLSCDDMAEVRGSHMPSLRRLVVGCSMVFKGIMERARSRGDLVSHEAWEYAG
ncbi:hypothetical protein LIA77_05983 [Sarocladium implicatum]|nr:hypothetical protein LIA77_05983 [Sarocladium implicatum]